VLIVVLTQSKVIQVGEISGSSEKWLFVLALH
jgi:hypothetical protein